MTYANAYGRFSVLDNLCGFSFGGDDPRPARRRRLNAVALAQIFGTGNGVPPTSGINLINNNSVGGPLLDAVSISPSTGLQDYNFDGARACGSSSPDRTQRAARRGSGSTQVQAHGDLHGKPAIIVHGRADNLVPVNHSSRPYYGLNKMVEGRDSHLRYYEVTNAQHFEAFSSAVSAGLTTRASCRCTSTASRR